MTPHTSMGGPGSGWKPAKVALWKLKSDEEFTQIVKNCKQIQDVALAMGYHDCVGNSFLGIKRRIYRLNISTDHMKGTTRGLNRIKNVSNLKLRRRSGSTLRKKMLDAGRLYICDICRCEDYTLWNGEWCWKDWPLKLQVDHIQGRDGTDKDDELDNLRFLCPNCHAQTPTFGRGKHMGKHNIKSKKGKNLPSWSTD